MLHIRARNVCSSLLLTRWESWVFEEIWLVLKRAMLELLEEEKPRTFEIYDDCTMIGVGSKCKPINIEQVRE